MSTRLLHIRDYVPKGSAFHFARIELGEIDLEHRHDHDFMELFWIESGRGTHWINGRERILDSGSLIFVLPQDLHVIGSAAPGERTLLCNLAFPIAGWKPMKDHHLCDEPGWFRPGPSERRERRVSERTLDFLRHAGVEFTLSPSSRLMLNRFFLNLAAALREEEEVQARIGGGIPPWLQQALIRVEREGLFRLGPSALTDAAGRTQEHVVREARRWLGKKPTELINEMRMRHAARLLGGTQQEILDISADCGIENVSHFYALFRKSHGMTPRHYRLRSQMIVRGGT